MLSVLHGVRLHTHTKQKTKNLLPYSNYHAETHIFCICEENAASEGYKYEIKFQDIWLLLQLFYSVTDESVRHNLLTSL